MADFLAAEWMKVRSRWLLYVVLLALLAGAALQIWLAGVLAYHQELNDPEFGEGPFPPGYRTFVLPWSLATLLDSGQFWGGVFVAFLVASAVATEYNWGTVRASLVRGQTRAEYLGAKLLGLMLIASGLLLLVFGVGVVFSLLATVIEGEPVTLDVRGGPSPAEIPVMIVRAGWGIVPYGMLAFALTVIGRSTALGATGTLVYKILESILIPLFGSFSGIWDDLRVIFIGYHAEGLIAANRIDQRDYNSIAFRDLPEPGDVPDPWAAAIVIAMWTVAFAAVAFVVFLRRDLNARGD